MKHSLFTILFVGLFALPSFAARLQEGERKNWQTRIANQCEINFKPSHNNKAAVCDCVARNFVGLSEKESTRQGTIGLLGYVEKFYGLKLSQKEMDKDPFFIDDYIQDIGTGCLKNASYSAPRTK